MSFKEVTYYGGKDYVYGLLMDSQHLTQSMGDGSHIINIYEMKV